MKSPLLSAALAGVFTIGLAASSMAASDMHDKMADKDKCYGIAKAGKNDCAAADGSHACSSHATVDNSKVDFVLTDKAACENAGGSFGAAAH